MSDDDARLRDAFLALRREDARDAPTFAALAHAEGPTRATFARRRWALAGAGALLLGLAFLLRSSAPEPSLLLDPPAPGELRTSTDVLLRTPGAALLREQPPPFLQLPPVPAPPGPTSSNPRAEMSA